ncbi:L,D-transpeptidase family protein [Mesobacillus subterraneus]|nr:L,D-transpeptidase family protein [Mesobacillus subterraneus]
MKTKFIKFFMVVLFIPLLIIPAYPSEASGISTSSEKARELKQEAAQMIVVTPSKKSKTTGTMQRYEKRNGKWKKVSTPMKVVIGKKGTGKTKEGDARTPVGTFRLGTSFGWGTKPTKTKYPFKKATKYDYWIDDAESKDYNKWVRYKGNPHKKWKSFERLNHPLYKYGVVIRYNEKPIVKGAGSAIFLHVKTSKTKYTLGCVATSEKNLIKTLKWLDSKKKPIIVIKP